MFSRRSLFLAATVLLTMTMAIPAAAQSPRDGFQYSVEISGPLKANMLYQAKLSEDVIVRSENDMRDIRLFSPDGTEVPFVILDNETPAEFLQSSYVFDKVEYSEDTSSATITLKLPEKHQPIKSIDLAVANSNFKKDVIVSGSSDMTNWAEITRDTIYDFSSKIDLRKTEIRFQSVEYRYFRLKVIDTDGGSGPEGSKSIHLKCEDVDFTFTNMKKDEKLRFDNFTGRTTNNLRRGRSMVFDSKVFTDLKPVIDKNKNSIITFEANLPLDRIYFDIANPYYFRDIKISYSDSGKEDSYQPLTNVSVHSFPLSDVNQVRTDFLVSSRKHRFYRFEIANKNNPALNITSIKFEWVQPIMFFAALGDAPNYTLCVGNPTAPAPEYDLNAFVSQANWFKQKYVTVNSAPPKRNENYKPDTPFDQGKRAQMEKMVLTVLVIGVVIILGFWMFKLMSQVPPRGPEGDNQN